MKASTQTTATTLIYPETADKWASKKQSSAQASGGIKRETYLGMKKELEPFGFGIF
ncbi:hypothetical protein DPMN_192736 [Dreissena polymorpha]|uniref:Uncharacterized protein n=1 Tax=Dreissena polymorpha TaxID=45954 RepID=A0A9D4BFP4_DREPO|nr:hypothetical protein DPMN_192736 [Dreissena polymorpha]